MVVAMQEEDEEFLNLEREGQSQDPTNNEDQQALNQEPVDEKTSNNYQDLRVTRDEFELSLKQDSNASNVRNREDFIKKLRENYDQNRKKIIEKVSTGNKQGLVQQLQMDTERKTEKKLIEFLTIGEMLNNVTKQIQDLRNTQSSDTKAIKKDAFSTVLSIPTGTKQIVNKFKKVQALEEEIKHSILSNSNKFLGMLYSVKNYIKKLTGIGQAKTLDSLITMYSRELKTLGKMLREYSKNDEKDLVVLDKYSKTLTKSISQDMSIHQKMDKIKEDLSIAKKRLLNLAQSPDVSPNMRFSYQDKLKGLDLLLLEVNMQLMRKRESVKDYRTTKDLIDKISKLIMINRQYLVIATDKLEHAQALVENTMKSLIRVRQEQRLVKLLYDSINKTGMFVSEAYQAVIEGSQKISEIINNESAFDIIQNSLQYHDSDLKQLLDDYLQDYKTQVDVTDFNM
ncbi:hypothetical protein J7L02_04290 [Candidatus Woesearchaeota archaeon]|nr:hypothetical protein [Candidatus Woesearchaeota archaeon]